MISKQAYALEQFRPESQCVKCGGIKAAVRYCRGAGHRDHLPGCEVYGDHLHRRCNTCGYEWTEKTLDNDGMIEPAQSEIECVEKLTGAEVSPPADSQIVLDGGQLP